jgi:histidinol-phosphate aminotransferase
MNLMKPINRRQWIKNAGLTGSLAILGGYSSIKAGPESNENYLVDSLKKGEPIRLSSNENPYGPSPAVRESLVKSFDDACRYPWAYSDKLIKAIATKEGVREDMIVLTGGSREGLKITGLHYGLNEGEIIAADPTYQALLTYAEEFGATVHRVPLNEKMQHDLLAMEKKITENTRLIFICNPNNPTGTLLPGDQVKEFSRRLSSEAVVFSDEAYYDYITEPDYPSMVSLVKEGLNVIVSRTFSKVYGLAGLRIGYLIARPDIAQKLRQRVVAFTNVLAIEAAYTSLKDQYFYRFSLRKNEEAKDYLYENFERMGLRYIPSHANFVFFHTGKNISSLIRDMKDQGVLIGRPFPPLTDWCRISTGTMEHMEYFIQALKKVL